MPSPPLPTLLVPEGKYEVQLNPKRMLQVRATFCLDFLYDLGWRIYQMRNLMLVRSCLLLKFSSNILTIVKPNLDLASRKPLSYKHQMIRTTF